MGTTAETLVTNLFIAIMQPGLRKQPIMLKCIGYNDK